jgi:hypothetical protein
VIDTSLTTDQDDLTDVFKALYVFVCPPRSSVDSNNAMAFDSHDVALGRAISFESHVFMDTISQLLRDRRYIAYVRTNITITVQLRKVFIDIA